VGQYLARFHERKAEMAALTRNELVKILTEIVHAARNRLLETRTADGLKAAEMLAKMCGWNEPERVNVQNVEVKVDTYRAAAPRPCGDERAWQGETRWRNLPDELVAYNAALLVDKGLVEGKAIKNQLGNVCKRSLDDTDLRWTRFPR
jgi:hypothetical protein